MFTSTTQGGHKNKTGFSSSLL